MEYIIIKQIEIDENRAFEGQELLNYLSLEDLQYKMIFSYENKKVIVRIVKEKGN